MRLKKEAIKGNSQVVQDLIDSLAEKVSFSQWPGEIELGGSIQPMLEEFLNNSFSIDYPEINNSLKVFNRVSTARKLLDTLSSIEPVWLVNNTQIDKSNSWSERIDEHLSVPKTFSDTLPVTLRLNSLDYTIVEYNGTLRVGGNYRKDKENFGISMKLDMVLKYANAEDFYVKLDPHTTNRFQDLDLDSRKLEYTRVQHTPFTSLFRYGKDIPLFRKGAVTIKPSNLSYIAILAYKGLIEGGLKGIKGEEKKTDSFFQKDNLYTNIEIEGLKIWDGKTGSSVNQPRLMQTLIEECNTLPDSDSFVSVECDKMEKAGKLIEIMEALKTKYADSLDLPPLLYRYKVLMDTPIPSLMDVESMDTPDLNILYTSWRNSMSEYRKELQSFNESFQANYEALSRILALKLKSRSLF